MCQREGHVRHHVPVGHAGVSADAGIRCTASTLHDAKNAQAIDAWENGGTPVQLQESKTCAVVA